MRYLLAGFVSALGFMFVNLAVDGREEWVATGIGVGLLTAAYTLWDDA